MDNGDRETTVRSAWLLVPLFLLSCCSTTLVLPPDQELDPDLPRIVTPGVLDYPEDARRAGIEGIIVSHVYIDSTGTVTRVEIVDRQFNYSGVYKEGIRKTLYIKDIFDQPTKAFWMQTKFKPALKDGKPVNARAAIPLHFHFRK